MVVCGVTHPRLYMYELPAEYRRRAPSCRLGFPPLVADDAALSTGAKRNGSRTPIAGPGGASLAPFLESLPAPPCQLHNTSNYALAGVFLAKCLRYPCRTLDPALAVRNLWASNPRARLL